MDMEAEGAKVRGFLEVVEHLAVNEAVVVVVLVQVPGGDVAGVGAFVVGGASLAIEDGDAFEGDGDDLRLARARAGNELKVVGVVVDRLNLFLGKVHGWLARS